MKYLAILGIAIGFVGGASLSYFWSRSVALKLSAGSKSPYIVALFSTVGGALMLVPAFFASIVIGGNIGGGLGGWATSTIGLGEIGVPFGLAAGIAVTLASGVVLGVLIGGTVGRVLSYASH